MGLIYRYQGDCVIASYRGRFDFTDDIRLLTYRVDWTKKL